MSISTLMISFQLLFLEIRRHELFLNKIVNETGVAAKDTGLYLSVAHKKVSWHT